MMSCFQLEVHTLLHNVHLTAKWRQESGNINVKEQKQASTRYSQEQSTYDMFFFAFHMFFLVSLMTMVREKGQVQSYHMCAYRGLGCVFKRVRYLDFSSSCLQMVGTLFISLQYSFQIMAYPT